MNSEKIQFSPDYYFRVMPKEEFFPQFEKIYESIFGQDQTFFPGRHYSAEEKEKIKKLEERLGNPYTLRIGIFTKSDEFIGFSFGFQETSESFYMAASGVLEKYRGKGLYKAALDLVVRLVVEEGFQIIFGTHCATNNAVIIPKLKAGFVIAKLEVSDMFGAIIHLHYFANPLRRKVMDYRSGLRRPDDEMKRVMRLT